MRLATTIRGFIPVMVVAVSAWALSAPASADENQVKRGGKESAALPVPCGDAAALVTAVSKANSTSGGGTVILATGCVYTLNSVAATGSNGPDGLPIITGNVTIAGTQATIKRAVSAPDFRIAEVASAGRLTLSGITMSGGRATTPTVGTGGGILDQGTLYLSQSTVTGNAASNVGGGVEVAAGGTATISTTDLTQNTAGDGGGIHVNTSGTLTYSGGTISGNISTSTGGGVASYGTTLLSSATIQGNSTTNFEGGGAFAGGGNLIISASRIARNTAGSFGGGIANFGSTLRVQSTTVSGNTATLNGGGLFSHAGTTQMIENSVTGNRANGGQGGGIFSDGGTVTLSVTTVFGNNPKNCVPALAGCTG